MKEPVIFATFAQDKEQLTHSLVMIESIRTFCGEYQNAPVWVFLPSSLLLEQPGLTHALALHNAELHIAHKPTPATQNLFYSWKVFAAATAEEEAENLSHHLVWLDEDTIFLQQPDCLMLNETACFGYRPVMHNRSGVQWDSNPNTFWQQIYSRLAISRESMFPMVTPADNVTIKPYFNAGLLVVRPEKCILRRWAACFETLGNDKVLTKMCLENVEHRIFIHQTALVGAVLPFIDKSEMIELPFTVNYPLFFHRMFKATTAFEDISDKVSIRYDAYFRNPDPDWPKQLKGNPETINWLQSRITSTQK